MPLTQGDYFLLSGGRFLKGREPFKVVSSQSEYQYKLKQFCNNDIVVTSNQELSRITLRIKMSQVLVALIFQ